MIQLDVSSSAAPSKKYEAAALPAFKNPPSDTKVHETAGGIAGEDSAPPSPEPLPRIDTALEQKLEQAIDGSGGTVSLVYVPLSGSASTLPSALNAPSPDAAFAIAGAARLPSASMIKLIILAELFDEAARGERSLDEQLVVAPGDIVGGSGVLQARGSGTVLTLQEAAGYMISDSDNVATNMIIDRLGMDAVNAQAARLGLDQTQLGRRMLDEGASSQGRDNYTSAADVAKLLGLIAEGRFVNASMSELALGFLEQQSDTGGIAEGVPTGVEVAHKTGTLNKVEHDGAVVLADKPYILVVMTEGLGHDKAKALMGELSKLVYERE